MEGDEIHSIRSNYIEWDQVRPSEIKWDRMRQNKIIWDQIRWNEIEWHDQLGLTSSAFFFQC